MKRRDWALLALSLSPDGALAPVQAQKAMFLLGQNTQTETADGFYHFEPYHYGPFDRNVYADLDTLIDEGLVQRKQSRRYSGTEFQITERGRARASRSAQESPELTRYLESVVQWMRPLSFSTLVSSIYKYYPAFRVKSIFRD